MILKPVPLVIEYFTNYHKSHLVKIESQRDMPQQTVTFSSKASPYLSFARVHSSLGL
jgi:hypothetical protein